MRVKVTKSKNSESLYIIKSFRDPVTKKSTSKIIEALGTRSALQEKLGAEADVMQWARERAAQLTEEEKLRQRRVVVSYDPSRQIEKGRRAIFNGGYLFLQAACAELGLKGITADIAKRRSFSFDLFCILSRLVFGRILEPASKRATTAFAQTLIEKPSFEPHQVYRALEVLAAENDFIQAELYKNSQRALGRKTGVLYYDCTNFFFEIEEEDDFRRFGLAKDHKPNPLVEMGLFMDADGMPLAFCMDAGNVSEQTTMLPLEEKLIADFGLSKFVTCTDAGLSSLANRRFNSCGERQFITTQSVKKLKAHLKTWALDPAGWSAQGCTKTFNLDEIARHYESDSLADSARASLRDRVFYKRRRIKEKDASSEGGSFEQELIVTFSFKHRDYQRHVRDSQIERALRAMKNDPGRMERKGLNDFRRLCKRTSVTGEGEIADTIKWELDAQAIAKEESFDGFYALATSFEDEDVETILKVNSQRWEIEECFRIMKTEFRARPVYLSREDRIRAHFLTCFIALLVFRVVEKKLGASFTCEEIIKTLKSMNFEEIRGEGWRPMYERNDITDALHKAFGFETDFEILTNQTMKKIIRQTKGR